MDTDRKWVVVRIDGKIAALSTDYRLLAKISAGLADRSRSKEIFHEITATSIGFEDVLELRRTTRWKDLMLFGTEFQKRVWRQLWDLSHTQDEDAHDEGAETTMQDCPKARHEEELKARKTEGRAKLICYTDFAEMCNNRAGVRAVAHAVGLNPVSVIIPCHLVVPKESIDRIREIQAKAQGTIFKGDDLCLDSILSDPAIDLGEYALGRDLKRALIRHDMGDIR